MIADNEWGVKLGAPKVLASATFGRQQPLCPGVAPSLQVRAAEWPLDRDEMSTVSWLIEDTSVRQVHMQNNKRTRQYIETLFQ